MDVYYLLTNKRLVITCIYRCAWKCYANWLLNVDSKLYIPSLVTCSVLTFDKKCKDKIFKLRKQKPLNLQSLDPLKFSSYTVANMCMYKMFN